MTPSFPHDALPISRQCSPAVLLLVARAAGWLNEEDWQVRAVLTDALVRNGQAADALALLGDEALPPVLTMRRAELVADAGDPAAAIVLAERAAAAEDTQIGRAHV